jgi:hypothetical protein
VTLARQNIELPFPARARISELLGSKRRIGIRVGTLRFTEKRNRSNAGPTMLHRYRGKARETAARLPGLSANQDAAARPPGDMLIIRSLIPERRNFRRDPTRLSSPATAHPLRLPNGDSPERQTLRLQGSETRRDRTPRDSVAETNRAACRDSVLASGQVVEASANLPRSINGSTV